MVRHPRPPSPSPPRANSDTDTGFDPVEEWLVDFDQGMADEMAKSLGLREEAAVVVQDATLPASCGLGKVSGVSVSESCGVGVKEGGMEEKGDAVLGQFGTSFGGELDVKMEPEMGSKGLDLQLAQDQLPASGIGDLAVREDISEVMVGVERSTVPVDADTNNMALVKEEAEGKGDKEDESDEEESESSEEEESSEASSSSDEEEEKRAKEDEESSEASSISDEEMAKKNSRVGDTEALLEEGELMLASDDDDDEAPKGPIKSKHEVEILPPVPKIEVQLEPHHQTPPVGTISAIMGERVIVEGSVQHNPLNEGSILWITESRTPLGIVDELFGPVKNPYYLVRYNSAEEVPAEISAGTAVSFVAEFADHILNMKELYAKGYDGSGENDEDQTDPEFSDDEKEAEYKRSLRLAKRQTDRQREGKKTSGDKKRAQPRGAGFRKDMPPMDCDGHTPGHQSQPRFNHPDTPVVDATRPLGSQDIPTSAPAMLPPGPVHPVMPSANQLTNQMGGCFINPSQQFLQQQPNVVWPGGLPPTPHPNMGVEGAAFAANMMQNLLIGANRYQQQFQNQSFGGFLNQMPVPPPQFMAQGGMASNPMAFGGPPMNPPFGPPPQLPLNQGNFGQPPHIAGNTLQQTPPSGFPSGQGFGHPAPTQGDGEHPPMQFSSGQSNQGNSFFRGRRPQQRGGRHSSGRGGGRHRR